MFIWIAIYAILLNSVFQILFWSCSVCQIVFLMIWMFFLASIYTSSYADEKCHFWGLQLKDGYPLELVGSWWPEMERTRQIICMWQSWWYHTCVGCQKNTVSYLTEARPKIDSSWITQQPCECGRKWKKWKIPKQQNLVEWGQPDAMGQNSGNLNKKTGLEYWGKHYL